MKVSKPTRIELENALAQACRMRETNEDPHCVAKSLLSYHYRIKFLEDVMDKVQHYLHSGLAAHEHSELLKTIESAQQAMRALEEEQVDFGLEPGE